MPRHARLRRTGRISRLMVAAVQQAVDALGRPLGTKRLGIACALSLGGVEYCHRFFKQVIEDGQHYASPILFPDTVFNSPASHLAACLDVGGPAYSLVGDESSWAQALLTAHTWLATHTVDEVLVVAAAELDPLVLEGLDSLGWLRNQRQPFRPAEGAVALVLNQTDNASACIKELTVGHDYATPLALKSQLRAIRSKLSQECPTLETAQDTWPGVMERRCLRGIPKLPCDTLPSLGGAFATSSAWYTLRLMQGLVSGHRAYQPVWGTMSSYSGLLLEKA